MRGRDQCLPRAARRARRLQVDLSVRRRSRRRLSRPPRPGHQQSGGRADRRAPHHGRLLTAVAGRRRYRFRRERLNIARTVKSLIKAGAGAMHIEDQVGAKRCGHRPGKELVSKEEMVDRIKAAVDAKTDPDFVVMARTDALAVEGLERAIERALACVEAGADAIFPEAVPELSMYRKFANAVKVPVLANITEFGATPLFALQELRSAGVAIALYPLSAFRAMNAAALRVYNAIRKEGTQKNVVDLMQTRDDLYEVLDYHAYERKLDQLFAKEKTR